MFDWIAFDADDTLWKNEEYYLEGRDRFLRILQKYGLQETDIHKFDQFEVENIRYFGSQPWPFPSSLMLGFTADYLSGEIVPDNVEITDARWFTRDNLPNLPMKGSISRRLIEAFL